MRSSQPLFTSPFPRSMPPVLCLRHDADPYFENMPKLAFGQPSKPSWTQLITQEVLGPFAPKSAYIWGSKRVLQDKAKCLHDLTKPATHEPAAGYDDALNKGKPSGSKEPGNPELQAPCDLTQAKGYRAIALHLAKVRKASCVGWLPSSKRGNQSSITTRGGRDKRKPSKSLIQGKILYSQVSYKQTDRTLCM